LVNIVTEHCGNIPVSQRDRDTKTGPLDLLVYYEAPEGQRDKIKRKFGNNARKLVALK
jgi:hypothetical protein